MFGAEEFQKATNVSRETLEKFKLYVELLERWQKKINLIGPATRKDVWRRHFMDSAQLLPLVLGSELGNGSRSWLDLGSGAGFPGLVLSLLGEEKIFLVEPSSKRAAFLREAIRETGAKAEVIQSKIAEISHFPVDIITARALTSVDQLLAWGVSFLQEGGEFWLLKGNRVEQELTLARKNWNMAQEIFPSRTNPEGKIIRLRNISMAGAA